MTILCPECVFNGIIMSIHNNNLQEVSCWKNRINEKAATNMRDQLLWSYSPYLPLNQGFSR